MDSNEIGNIIMMHRRAAKLSRIELANMAGLGKTVIYDVEHGKNTVQLDTLLKIFQVLGIELKLESKFLSNLRS